METVQRDIDDYLETARALADQIAAHTDRIDSARQHANIVSIREDQDFSLSSSLVVARLVGVGSAPLASLAMSA